MRSTIPNPTEACQWAQSLTPTILLVEDEPAVREVTREALEMGGYRVLEADGPEEAAHIASEPSNQIDVLLTDVVMPGMSGPDLAHQVRKLRPGLVTVFMSGYAECEVLRAAAHGALRDHIQKPFTVSGLLSRVAQALATRWNARHGNRTPQSTSP
jgi:two-component system, cell cycle sensor histidine kinase and response regulator CckA